VDQGPNDEGDNVAKHEAEKNPQRTPFILVLLSRIPPTTPLRVVPVISHISSMSFLVSPRNARLKRKELKAKAI
jgi:hypothetical protein